MTETDNSPQGDVAAALDAARENLEFVETREDRVVIAHRHDVDVRTIDFDDLRPRPRRATGIQKVSSAAGFVAAVNQRQLSDEENMPIIYADNAEMALVCVMNDHGPEGPGWRDHLIELRLERTEEWEHWLNGQGQRGQEAFARHIQEGMAEIVSPEPSVMMDVAQNFHMTSQSKAKQAKRLKDGRTQVVYEEDVDASAGEDGTVEIPDTFELKARPFYGSALFDVMARLEFTPPRSGSLSIGYQLHRPRDVERAAYAKIVETVAEELDIVVVEGAV